MNSSETLNLIKESFECWYNKQLPADESPVSVIINYSDVQTLSIKAYHTICMEVQAVGIREGKSHVIPLLRLQENYNHGIVSEDEAKLGLIRKMLMEMFDFPASSLLCKS